MLKKGIGLSQPIFSLLDFQQFSVIAYNVAFSIRYRDGCFVIAGIYP